MLYPHLAWYIIDGCPTLYRRDMMGWRGYDTCAEACEAAGIDLEDFIRSH